MRIQCGGRLVPIFSTLPALISGLIASPMQCDGVGVLPLMSDPQLRDACLHKAFAQAILLYGLILKRQTNGSAITVDG